jgi:hypothetical protein
MSTQLLCPNNSCPNTTTQVQKQAVVQLYRQNLLLLVPLQMAIL